MTKSTTHPLARLETLVLVAIGGFAGSNLRYFVDLLLPGMGGTLLVNVVGSCVLGFVLYESMILDVLTGKTRLVVATGFLSSLTTYSTFAMESAQATPGWLIANVLAHYALGFAAILLGRLLARLAERRWSG